MLAGIGSSVVYGSSPVQTCSGSLKRLSVDEATAAGLSRIGVQTVLTIRDGALASLIDDATITVDGVDYVIRDIGVALQDGTRRLTVVAVEAS